MGHDRLIELVLLVKVKGALKILVGEVSQGQSAHKLAIRLKDFGSQSQSNVRGRAEIMAHDQLIVRIRRDVIPVHYPMVPTKFTAMADVSS
jgi:hypothetical protein